MKVGVVVFPASNCDHDAYHAFKHVLGVQTNYLWHKETELADFDLVVLPGGFSFGDYLRCGALARFSPIMEAVAAFAAGGGKVLGICNGFQVLTEAGLLPGALLRNRQLRFVCETVTLRVENNATPFTHRYGAGEIVRMPVAHGDGNYFIDPAGYRQLLENGQIVLRYCDDAGESTEESSPNGSLGGIAGIVNRAGNVLGMMPHPERCAEQIMGNTAGRRLLESAVSVLAPS